MRWLARAGACAAVLGASAEAGEELKCAAQFKLEEHLILEWAALGGDPQAQYSVAQCAFPSNAGELSSAEKTYALKWLTLATCEAQGVAGYKDRDRATRNLKLGSNISFRRFGGVTKDELWTGKERSLISIRDRQTADLEARLEKLKAQSTEAEQAGAREALADELARMGPLGIMRLIELTSCQAYGASDAFAAAAWSAAAESWAASGSTSVYGPSAISDRDLKSEGARRMAQLSKNDRRVAAARKDMLLRSDAAHLAELEDAAALGRLQNLGSADAGEEGLKLSGRSTTTAVQYALESLGFIEFVNGPDNDYGPSTIEAVKKAQAAYGHPQTRLLAPEEVRQVVCDAAVTKSDPISYYHLSLMYAEGLGFRKDLVRAKAAISRAEEILIARLESKDALPPWKAREYPAYLERIGDAKGAIGEAYSALPRHVASGGGEICR